MATIDGHDYVEIGGMFWATMNVGANSITDVGQYFQWGDTTGYAVSAAGTGNNKKRFRWVDHKFSYNYHTSDDEPDGTELTKYGTYYINYCGTAYTYTLDLCDDAARVNWGGRWRMPTREEFNALSAATTSEYVTNYQGSGVNGMLLTDINNSSNKLFFPYGGRLVNDGNNDTYYGWYHSSTQREDKIVDCQPFLFYGNGQWEVSNRHWTNGCNIRPVIGFTKKPRSLKFSVNKIGSGETTSNIVIPTDNDFGLIGKVTYTSSNPNIIAVINGTKLSGVTSGSCTITATMAETTDYTSATTSGSVEVKVKINGHDYVDLGLPSGTLWATTNVGAGDEYRGGINGYYGNVKNYTGTENPLAASADTATINWGSPWHSPTQAQVNELFNNTNFTMFYDDSGKLCCRFTSRTGGRYIIFPGSNYYLTSSPNGDTRCVMFYRNSIYTNSRTAPGYFRPVIG